MNNANRLSIAASVAGERKLVRDNTTKVPQKLCGTYRQEN
jgi:hypothetical protein